jgi:anti-anti-sigma factor
MAQGQLRTSVRLADTSVVIDLQGEIDAFGRDALTAAFDEADGAGRPGIVLNFAAVNYINSTGIALIVALLQKAATSGKRLLACGLNDHYVQIFTITRLSEYLRIFPDEARALQHVQNDA